MQVGSDLSGDGEPPLLHVTDQYRGSRHGLRFDQVQDPERIIGSCGGQ